MKILEDLSESCTFDLDFASLVVHIRSHDFMLTDNAIKFIDSLLSCAGSGDTVRGVADKIVDSGCLSAMLISVSQLRELAAPHDIGISMALKRCTTSLISTQVLVH